MADDTDQEIADIVEWFAERGFELRLTREEDDLVWAELARSSSGPVVAPMYGRGDSEVAAARRAQQRFASEQ